MGLDLAAVAINEATTTVDFMGQSARVTYKPSVITQEALENTSDDDGFLKFFSEAVSSWDVTEGKKKVPIEPAALKKVPLVFLRAVFQSIMEDGGQGEAPAASSDGSRSTGRKATAPSGTTS